jgi:hypothetical protein
MLSPPTMSIFASRSPSWMSDLLEAELLVLLDLEPVLLVGARPLREGVHRLGLLVQAAGFRHVAVLEGARLGGAHLLDRQRVRLLDLGGGEPVGGVLGLPTLGEPDLRRRLLVGRLEPGLRQGDLFSGLVAGCLLGGLRGLHVLDQLLLGLGLGGDDRRILGAAGVLHDTDGLDRLLLLGHRPVHRDAFADDVGDLALLHLELLVLVDAQELRLALTGDGLEIACLRHALGLDRDHALPVLLRNRDLAGPVLLLDCDLLVGLDTRVLRLEPLFLLHLGGLGLLSCAHLGDLSLLLRLGVGLLALELEDCLDALHVLLLDLLQLVVLEVIRVHVLRRGELGDLADALGVEDVLVVEVLERRLLEEVERSDRGSPLAGCRGRRSRAACRRS